MPVDAHPVADCADIVLCTLNAKYLHASLGLRYVLANMGELAEHTALREFTIHRPVQDMADALLSLRPRIIGLGVYIWNVTETTELVRVLKQRCPGVKIVLGGPEVSHEWESQQIVQWADHVITGWGDISFPALCRALLHGPSPLMKVVVGVQPDLADIVLPYGLYTDTDLAHRLVYVEASRGCPFRCEFCLSSLDKTARAFPLDAFLAAMDRLYQRGARHFKFVDRTFNLKVDSSARILQFFLDRLTEGLFLHFEVIPDHLPARLKDLLVQFPPGVLQLEVGVQTFDADVQHRISRRQDNDKTVANLAWLVQHTHAHLHADLIFGLPGETLTGFAAGFDRLHALRPHEIQLGVLKRLRGTPIARHTLEWGMQYAAYAPYTVVHTGAVDATTVQRFTRLARYWDLVANSGRFPATLDLLLHMPSVFAAFLDWSDWLWQATGQQHGMTPEDLVDALFAYLTGPRGVPQDRVRGALLADYGASGARGMPQCLRGVLPRQVPGARPELRHSLASRQERHGPPPHGV